MGHDMLVKLYNIKRDESLLQRLKESGVEIKRVIPPDLYRVLEFVKENFSEGWVAECHYAIMKNCCHIAVRDHKVVGFACCDTTAKGFFGPTGVAESERGQGIGTALLLESLLLLRELGYGYGIIGWVDDATVFYEKTVNATIIPDSFPGVYRDLIRYE